MPRNSRHTQPIDGALYWKCCAVAALTPAKYTLNPVELHTLHIILHHYHVGRPVHVSVIEAARTIYQECREMVPRVTRDPDIGFRRKKLPLRPGPHPVAASSRTASATALPDKLGMTPLVDAPDIAELRRTLGMSQKRFAATYFLPLGIVKEWENGRRPIDAVGAAYLAMIGADRNTARK